MRICPFTKPSQNNTPMTPEPNLFSLAEACAKELHPHPDCTITKIEYDALMGKRRRVVSVILSHLQPLAKDRERYLDALQCINKRTKGYVETDQATLCELQDYNDSLSALTPKPASAS
jgi:hypothetical protein